MMTGWSDPDNQEPTEDVAIASRATPDSAPDHQNIVRELGFTLDHLVIVCTNGAAVRLNRWGLGPLAPTENPGGWRQGSFWNELENWEPVDGGTAIKWPAMGYVVQIPQPEKLCTYCGKPRWVHQNYGTMAELCPGRASFANAPITIGEARAQRAGSAAAWSPRDVLVQLLREIDSGDLKPSAMVVSMAVPQPDGTMAHSYRNACPDNFVALGLLARAAHRLQE